MAVFARSFWGALPSGKLSSLAAWVPANSLASLGGPGSRAKLYVLIRLTHALQICIHTIFVECAMVMHATGFVLGVSREMVWRFSRLGLRSVGV